MLRKKRNDRKKQNGIALVMALIFVTLFSTLAIAMFTMSVTSVQASSNHQESNHALNAAQSGLEYAKYLASSAGSVDVVLDYAAYKAGDFSSQADAIWNNLAANAQLSVSGTDGEGKAYIETGDITYSAVGATFKVRFTREDSNTIMASSTGVNGQIQRAIGITFNIAKEDDEILNYGLVGRGRMWLAGDTTIYGDIYSSWDNASVAPFNMTDDSTVLGTINTVLTKDTVDSRSWDLETTDGDDNAMFEYDGTVYDAFGEEVTDSYGHVNEDGHMTDSYGNLVYDDEGNYVPVDYDNRIINSDDELQGYHEGVNYDAEKNNIDNMLDIDSYDTDLYKDRVMSQGGNIPASSTIATEYFPHGPDGYDDYKSGSRTVRRHVYENVTFNDVRLPDNRNALFKNCTFENVLYIDCYKSTSSYYNNVRFEDCTFNGVIATDTPSSLKWQYNALYFTGSANFNNTSDIQEATILAPHFNVNLGDANNGEVEGDENVITGAVVGGIVDIRGNAKIYGTVISMCDTSNWTSGYVTNIGATLNDGGSETTSIEDIGTIEVTPDPEQSLFPGLKEYPCTISLQADSSTYCELN